MSVPGCDTTVEEPLIRRLARRIDGISTLPHVAVRVMEVAGDPNASAGDLKRVLEADASLSARVLRSVNSAAHAIRNDVTNLQLAIAYLGFKQIRNLAVTASVSDIFKKDETIGTYSRLALWRHLVSVGICARLIALRQGISAFEDAFLAGLLHDIGIILEDQHMHADFREVMLGLTPEKSLSQVEHERLGFDHAQLGAEIADLWRFPEIVCAAIRYHHASQVYQGEHTAIVRVVEVANLLCTLKDITSVGMKLVRPNRPAMEALGLGKQDLEVLAIDLDRELRLYSDLYKL